MGKPKIRISHYTTNNIPLPEQQPVDNLAANKTQIIHIGQGGKTAVLKISNGTTSKKNLSNKLRIYQIESQYASKPRSENSAEF